MTPFKLVRLPNDDFVLSAGSGISVDTTYVELIVHPGAARAAEPTPTNIQMAASMMPGAAFTSQKQAR